MTRLEATFVIAAVAACLGAVAMLAPSSPPRVAAAIVLLLYLPGYLLRGLLLPELGALEAWMRVVVSVGLSMVILGLLGLGAALLAVPASTPAVPIAAALLTLGMVAVSQIGRVRFAKQVRPRARVGSVLAAAFFLALPAGALLGRTISQPALPAPFTTFAVVGPDGTVESLPDVEDCLSPTTVTLQIQSHELEAKVYEVWQSWDTRAMRVHGPFRLQPDERREVSIAVRGSRLVPEPIRFELHTPGQSAAYRSVQFCAAARPD